MLFIVRRLVFYLVAAWVALTINFFIPRLMPGNAVQSIMSKFPNLQPAAYRALEALLGVGKPGSIWHQYWAYLDDVFHLNFGTDVTQYPARSPPCSARRSPGRSSWWAQRRSSPSSWAPRSASWPAGGTAAASTGSSPG